MDVTCVVTMIARMNGYTLAEEFLYFWDEWSSQGEVRERDIRCAERPKQWANEVTIRCVDALRAYLGVPEIVCDLRLLDPCRGEVCVQPGGGSVAG